MKFAIIVSTKDIASMNIKDALNNIGIDNLHIIDKELIYSNDLDKEINADYFIFASKHKAASGIPSLTVHSIGNWGKAELGGFDNKLVSNFAAYQRLAYLNLNKFAQGLNYDIIQEVTHHGPYLEKQAIFIEIGSNEEQHKDKKAAEIIAKTINSLINEKAEADKIAVGIGGLHNCPIFNKIVLKHNIGFAHICPKYQLQNLNEDVLKQAIEKTKEKVDFVVLDWKGLGQEKTRILELLEKLGLNYKRSNKI